MALNDWTNDLFTKEDHQLGNIRIWRKKNGLRPYVDSIELRKPKEGRYKGDYLLIGSSWDLVFKTRNEAITHAIAYMRTH